MLHKVLNYFLALCFILAFSWSQSGYIVVQVCRSVHYHQIHSRAAKKLGDTITIAEADLAGLNRIKKDEILYKGRMFDIKQQIYKDGTILLVGHYDEKDDGLMASLRSFFNDEGSDNDDSGVHFRGLALEAIIPSMELGLRTISYRPDNITHLSGVSFYRSYIVSPALQPPDLS